MNAKTVSDMICIIAAGILLIMTIIAILKGQRASYEVNTGFFCAFMCLAPMILRRAKVIELPLTLVVIAEISIFLHAYGVLLMQYDNISSWDTVTHSVSSITVSLCIFYALMAINMFDPMIRMTRGWMPVFIFLIAVAFGGYWESFEFAVDNLTGINMQYSSWDSIRDLLCDILGAVLISIYAYIYLGRRNEKDFVEGLKIHPFLGKIVKSRG